LTTAVDKIAVAPSVSDIPKTVPDPIMPFKSISEPPTSIMRASSSVTNEGKTPSLVTPGQLLQPGPPIMPSLQSSHIAQKDVEVVQVSSPELSAPPPTTALTEVQESILPLPSQPEHKVCKFAESSIIVDLRKFEIDHFKLMFPGALFGDKFFSTSFSHKLFEL
jgi:protein LSM14